MQIDNRHVSVLNVLQIVCLNLTVFFITKMIWLGMITTK